MQAVGDATSADHPPAWPQGGPRTRGLQHAGHEAGRITAGRLRDCSGDRPQRRLLRQPVRRLRPQLRISSTTRAARHDRSGTVCRHECTLSLGPGKLYEMQATLRLGGSQLLQCEQRLRGKLQQT